jgi:hypothetical protein
MIEEGTDPGARPDVVAELKRLGRQMGETLDAIWGSAERRKVEEDLRAGARAFADEFESALGRARTARPAGMASKARRSAVDGLRWMSAELEALADRFTPIADEDSGESAASEGAGRA